MAVKKSSAKNSNKETIYIDVDDEITNIIDKVKGAEHKIIALVLPKRAAVLQSIVNMKLLKKAAASAKKNIVLITSETGLLPLAGAAGLHVARSLQSKPEIPPAPRQADDTEETMSDESETLDKNASIGALATAAASDDDTETIEFDNIKVDVGPTAAIAKKTKKLKHLKVPNFERFRLGFVLAGLGAVLLIIGWIFAAIVLPKATITVRTDTTTVVSSFDFTASKDQPELDVNDKKIPAVFKESKKSDKEKAAATGEKNNGEKAEGSVKLKGQSCHPNINTPPNSVPTGSTVTSSGKNFITQESMTFHFVNFASGSCANYETSGGEILAAEQGADYNLAGGSSFTVANRSGITGTGSASGGSDDIVKVVTQKDIDDAVARIAERQGSNSKDELKSALQTESGIFALTETFISGDAKVVATPKVGEEAAETTVTWEATYSMLGVKRTDLTEVIKKDVEGEIDLEKQSISNDGIDTSIMRINNNPTAGSAFLNFRTSVTAGPEFDEQVIKDAIRGKKRGEVEKYIGDLPGVNEVIVDYDPFWVFSTPKAAKKINIVILNADDQQATSTDSDE